MYLTENLQDKWQPVLEHPDLPKIGDAYKRAVTTVILENQEKAVREDRSFMSEAAPTNATGSSVDNWDPVLISLVRRAMPNLIAYDICGVQPMTGPTGLIFAMKSRFGTQAGAEALFNEADSDFSSRDAASDTGSTSVQAGTNPATLNDIHLLVLTLLVTVCLLHKQKHLVTELMSLLKWLSQSIKLRLLQNQELLKLNTLWNLLKT